MATQAKITFTALNGDSLLPERTLALHPHLRTVQIGRASKTPSKGLQASLDNAWFDSPVMSRNHAEISLDIKSNVITIRDIGSMHGTFVNDFQLPRHEPHGLSNDDLVVFGAEIKRNLDTFPACAFRVNYEFLPFKANISYAYPDYDDEDYEISDDDLEDNEEPSSEDGVSIESPPQKVSQAIHAIDLTRDDSPVSVIEQGDLTGETPAEKDLMDVMAGRPADIDRHADPVSVAIYAGNPPISVDSDDEDAHFSSDSDDQSDEVEYDDGASSPRDSIDEQEDSENEDGSDQEMDRVENANPELKDFQDKESERASGLAGLGLYAYLNQPVPESNLRAVVEVSEDIVGEDDEDDESDFGLSDAGAEGIRALFDDRLVDNTGDAYFEEIDDESDSDGVVAYEAPTQTPKAADKLESPKHVTFASIPSELVQEMATVLNARQPSPSDAAMVKTTAPSTTLLGPISNPIRVHHLPSQDFQKLTAQSLGEKTGKHAFFAAREDNKAKISAGETDRPQQASLQTTEAEASSIAEKRQRLITATGRFRERKRRMEEEAKMMLSETANIIPIQAVNTTIPPLTTLPYLDDHTQAPNAIRTPSPEPDMTSAVTYNESKASMAFANKHTYGGRSGISINDIVERSVEDQGSKKRKSDDISEAIENEIRVWATSSSALNDSDVAMDSTAAIREEPSETPPAPAPVPKISELRPAKRLRKIVESVGYVALGGATLFGALVLSAPDFL